MRRRSGGIPALLAGALLLAAAAPAAGAGMLDSIARAMRAPNVRARLTLADPAAAPAVVETLTRRLAAAGGRVAAHEREGDALVVTAYAPEPAEATLRALLAPGHLAVARVLEVRMDEAVRSFLPLPDGLRAEVFAPPGGGAVSRSIVARDRAALARFLATHEVAGGVWRVQPDAPRDGEHHALLLAAPVVTNEHVTAATPDDGPWGAYVGITLDDRGAAAFLAATRASVNQRVAIVLDGAVSNAPVVREPIPGGRLQISFGPPGGADATHSARLLAALLAAGPLPTAVTVASIASP